MRTDALYIYVVYENPSDYPGEFVVKRDDIMLGKVTRDPVFILRSRHYSFIRHAMETLGLYRMNRMMGDDPVIRETWI